MSRAEGSRKVQTYHRPGPWLGSVPMYLNQLKARRPFCQMSTFHSTRANMLPLTSDHLFAAVLGRRTALARGQRQNLADAICEEGDGRSVAQMERRRSILMRRITSETWKRRRSCTEVQRRAPRDGEETPYPEDGPKCHEKVGIALQAYELGPHIRNVVDLQTADQRR